MKTKVYATHISTTKAYSLPTERRGHATSTDPLYIQTWKQDMLYSTAERHTSTLIVYRLLTAWQLCADKASLNSPRQKTAVTYLKALSAGRFGYVL